MRLHGTGRFWRRNAYEKGETYPQKRSTYQTLADILGVQADDLHNEETTASAPPLTRTQWENSKRRYEELLPDGSVWPTGWTRGLCRMHGRHPAKRSVSPFADDF